MDSTQITAITFVSKMNMKVPGMFCPYYLNICFERIKMVIESKRTIKLTAQAPNTFFFSHFSLKSIIKHLKSLLGPTMGISD